MATITTPDLKDPGLYEAGVPWNLFAALRRDDPVHWNPETDGAGFWSVMRHADIVEVSRQPLLFSSAHENGGHRIFNENEVGLTGAGSGTKFGLALAGLGDVDGFGTGVVDVAAPQFVPRLEKTTDTLGKRGLAPVAPRRERTTETLGKRGGSFVPWW